MKAAEKALTYGTSKLSTIELLSVVGGISNSKALEVFEKFGSLQAIEKAGTYELTKIKGIGFKTVAKLRSAFKLGRAMCQATPSRGDHFNSSESVYQYFNSKLLGEEQESFYICYLNTKNRLISIKEVAKGSVTGCKVSLQAIFKEAVRENAVKIIAVHNHPSGNPEPSREDKSMTAKLSEVGQFLGISLIDHVIIGHNKYVSFADRGWL